MAVPKKKRSKRRNNRRFSYNTKISLFNFKKGYYVNHFPLLVSLVNGEIESDYYASLKSIKK